MSLSISALRTWAKDLSSVVKCVKEGRWWLVVIMVNDAIDSDVDNRGDDGVMMVMMVIMVMMVNDGEWWWSLCWYDTAMCSMLIGLLHSMKNKFQSLIKKAPVSEHVSASNLQAETININYNDRQRCFLFHYQTQMIYRLSKLISKDSRLPTPSAAAPPPEAKRRTSGSFNHHVPLRQPPLTLREVRVCLEGHFYQMGCPLSSSWATVPPSAGSEVKADQQAFSLQPMPTKPG